MILRWGGSYQSLSPLALHVASSVSISGNCLRRCCTSSPATIQSRLLDSIVKLVPQNGATIPLSQLVARLTDDLLDALERQSLREVIELKPETFQILTDPSTGRLSVRRRHSDASTPRCIAPNDLGRFVPPPPSLPIGGVTLESAVPVPVASSPARRKNKFKLCFEDCWNSSSITPRNLFEEYSEYVALSESAEEINPPTDTDPPPRVAGTDRLRKLLPQRLTRLDSFLKFLMHLGLEQGACAAAVVSHEQNPATLDCDDVVSAQYIHVVKSMLLPLRQHVVAIAVRRASLENIESCSADDGGVSNNPSRSNAPVSSDSIDLRRNALFDPEYLKAPASFVLYMALHPRELLGEKNEAPTSSSDDVPNHHFLRDQRLEAQEFDAFRLARMLDVVNPTPWAALLRCSQGLLVDGTIQTLVMVVLAFPELFEVCPGMDGVRYRLDTQYIPADIDQYTPDQLDQCIAERRQGSRQAKTSGNKERVKAIEEARYFKRLAAMKSKLIPACDPDVLAHWLFDLLEEVDEPPETGVAVTILPEEVQARTNGRSKTFLRRYPHLFRIQFIPPSYRLFRSDWPIVDAISPEALAAMTSSDLLTSVGAAVLDCKRNRMNKAARISNIVKHMPREVVKLIKHRHGSLKAFAELNSEFFEVDGDVISPKSLDI